MSEKPLGLRAIRHMLASIDIEDIEKQEMSESERKEYIAAISAVYPRLEKDIKEALHQQLLFCSNHAENMDQVAFGRGTFNGMALLMEKWKKAHEEHTAREPKEEFDEHSPISEVE